MKYTPAEASALTSLPIRTVRRLIDRRLIRPRRLQTGRSVQRLLSWEQLVYLRLEDEGLALLPVAERRRIAKQIEADAGIDVVSVSEGSALLIQVKTVRKELDERLKKLERAESVVVEDAEAMRGTPVYRGTRIPVELIADMLNQGASIDEILQGYPALDREKVEPATREVPKSTPSGQEDRLTSNSNTRYQSFATRVEMGVLGSLGCSESSMGRSIFHRARAV